MCLRRKVGRYPRGSGARTVVARPPSGSTRGAPRAGEWDSAMAPRQRPRVPVGRPRRSLRAPTRFSRRALKVPLALPVGPGEVPLGAARRSQWGARDAPSGTLEAPSGRWASTEWDPRVGPCRGRVDLVAADSTLNGARYALATSLQGRRRRQKARREHQPPMHPQQGSLDPSHAT